ncbi:fibronectin type III-like domain-contianing protein [Paraflavitalea speifideaquila]|uniref:fibronectin type III-like domain-contianing protein n=1 Tax=Paraflavitalea speifideaquila TaxID=3076558 RepID=UPI0028EBDAEE|nr:fibronectin type III-like domain-contianing protein [Paraflavitalea speifideiaquila]
MQLYIHQKMASVTRPVKELKGFARVTLAPGEKKTVQFTLDATKLAFWDSELKYRTETSTIEVMTGKNSNNLQKINLTIEN